MKTAEEGLEWRDEEVRKDAEACPRAEFLRLVQCDAIESAAEKADRPVDRAVMHETTCGCAVCESNRIAAKIRELKPT